MHRRNLTLLVEALAALERLAVEQNRKPLRAWLDELQPPSGYLLAVGIGNLPTAQRETLRRLGARTLEVSRRAVASRSRHRAG